MIRSSIVSGFIGPENSIFKPYWKGSANEPSEGYVLTTLGKGTVVKMALVARSSDAPPLAASAEVATVKV